MRKIFIFTIFVILLVGCKSTNKTNRETEAKILFKNLIKASENLNNVYIEGLFKLTGVKDVPQAFINFQTYGNFKKQLMTFKILFLKKPLIEISVNKNDIMFINHTGKEYIKLQYDNVDFSKFIGINFDPLEIGYFFIGSIPYSTDTELMSFNYTKDGLVMQLTNNMSMYTILVNDKEQITSIKINNQYFDVINVDGIQYTKNDAGLDVPKNINFSTDDKNVKMSFIIDKISFNPQETNISSLEFLSQYNEVFNINDIKVKLK